MDASGQNASPCEPARTTSSLPTQRGSYPAVIEHTSARAHDDDAAPTPAPAAAPKPQGKISHVTSRRETAAAAPSACDAFLAAIIKAQDSSHASFAAALREINAGRRSSHWIWYVWPSHKEVRRTSRPEYALPHSSFAVAWLRHPVLGHRLLEITSSACKHLESGLAARTLFGSAVDVDKFAECMAVFLVAAEHQQPPLEESAAICRKALLLLDRPGAHEGAHEVAMREMAAVTVGVAAASLEGEPRT